MPASFRNEQQLQSQRSLIFLDPKKLTIYWPVSWPPSPAGRRRPTTRTRQSSTRETYINDSFAKKNHKNYKNDFLCTKNKVLYTVQFHIILLGLLILGDIQSIPIFRNTVYMYTEIRHGILKWPVRTIYNFLFREIYSFIHFASNSERSLLAYKTCAFNIWSISTLEQSKYIICINWTIWLYTIDGFSRRSSSSWCSWSRWRRTSTTRSNPAVNPRIRADGLRLGKEMRSLIAGILGSRPRDSFRMSLGTP